MAAWARRETLQCWPTAWHFRREAHPKELPQGRTGADRIFREVKFRARASQAHEELIDITPPPSKPGANTVRRLPLTSISTGSPVRLSVLNSTMATPCQPPNPSGVGLLLADTAD